jgi:hypothetical protein
MLKSINYRLECVINAHNLNEIQPCMESLKRNCADRLSDIDEPTVR